MPDRTLTRPARARHVVTGVLVAHDGDRWLPEVLEAIRRQTRTPDAVVAADTGSTDSGPALLAAALGADAVVTLDRTCGFGAAVAAALSRARPAPQGVTRWLWLLHDDSAPAPDALARLLDEADASPSAAVLGCKAVDWEDPHRLLEVGVTVDPGGHRHTGLEHGELDQGQHDSTRDVLAVSTAGMLVRADVWEALAGLEPALPLWRDDLDLCWRARAAGHRVLVVPGAVVRHAEAATRGRRAATVSGGEHPRRTDRRHALTVLLAHETRPRLVLTVLRLVVGALLRSAVLALGKRARDGLDELAALAGVLGHPGRLAALRRARARGRAGQAAAARGLRAPYGTGLRRARDDLGRALGSLSARLGLDDGPAPARPVETGPSELDDGPAPVGVGHLLRRVVARPSALLVLGLVVVALIACRHLLAGGQLAGGALLPAPRGGSDLWRGFTASWGEVGPGGPARQGPWLVVLAALTVPVLGSAAHLVAAVLVLGVPVSAATAYVAARAVAPSRWVRSWLAATYALLPPLLGAVAAGRVGAVVVHAMLPLLVLAVVRALQPPGRDAVRRVAVAALLGAAVLALAPALAPVLVALAAATAALAQGPALRRAAAAAAVCVGPALLLLPWTGGLLAHPSRSALDPGFAAPGLTAPLTAPWKVLLAWPGGPGLPLPALALLPLLAAAVTGVARRRGAAAAWAVGLVAVVDGVLVARALVPSPAGPVVAGWPGAECSAVGLALLVAAADGLRGARAALRDLPFSWRQPLSALVTLAGLVAVVAAPLAWAVRGAGTPVRRVERDVRPAFVAAEAQGPTGPRTLVVAGAGDPARYDLVRAEPTGLGLADAGPQPDQRHRLDDAVRDLLAGRGNAAVERVASYGVRRVALVAPADPTTVTRLDTTAGLSRVAVDSPTLLWQVVAPAGRAVVLDPEAAAAAASGGGPDPSLLAAHPLQPVSGARHVEVPAGPDGRWLVLAEAADDGWTATLAGRRLPRERAWGWAQAFRVPGSGGPVTVEHRDPGHRRWLAAEGVLTALALLVAAPSARRRPDEPVAGPPRSSPPPPAAVSVPVGAGSVR